MSRPSQRVPILCENCTRIFHVKPERLQRVSKPRFCSNDCRKHSNQPARFWRHVERRGPDECWPWRGGRERGFLFDGAHYHAHSVAFRLTHGRWPKYGGQTCGNRRCANPAHVIDERANMIDEPDWTQENPTKEQVEDWLRDRIREGKQLSADAYGWDAFLHFQRPFHINVCKDMARRIMEEENGRGRNY